LTQIGCGVWLFLFFVLGLFGAATGIRHGAGIMLGAAWGLTTWLAAFCGYAVLLSIADWHTRRTRKPDLIGVPKWFVAAIWVCFLIAAPGSVLLYRRLRGF
jgi:hypothetical protein